MQYVLVMPPATKISGLLAALIGGAILTYFLWRKRRYEELSSGSTSGNNIHPSHSVSGNQEQVVSPHVGSGISDLEGSGREVCCDEQQGSSPGKRLYGRSTEGVAEAGWGVTHLRDDDERAAGRGGSGLPENSLGGESGGEGMPHGGGRVSVGSQPGRAVAHCVESSSDDGNDSQGNVAVSRDDCKVFVSNISFAVRTRELRDFFEFFGRVTKVQLLKDRNRKRSRGMAFITFSSRPAADRAKQATKYDLTLDGRVMKCNALERRSRRKSHVEKQLRASGGDGGSSKTPVGVQYIPPEQVPRGAGDGAGEEEEMVDGSPINSLPDDILAEVFGYLSLKERIRTEFVCRRWRAVCLSSWCSQRSLHFKNVFKGLLFSDEKGPCALNDSIFKSIMNKGCHNLRHLDVSASPMFITSKSMNYIGHICKELRYLDLSSTIVDNTSLRTLTDGCRKIETVILKRCNNLGEKGIWWLFHNCENLTHVDLEDNRRINGKCFHILNKHCKKVVIAGCSSITDKGLGCLTAKCGESLEELDISACLMVTDLGMESIREKCCKLKTLLFCGFHSKVTSSGLQSLVSLPCLRTLHLSRHPAVDDALLTKVGRHCTSLRELKIDACSFPDVTDTGVQCLARCPGLEVLNISYLGKTTDEGLKPVALGGRLHKLVARSLHLTDEVMGLLASHCPRLCELDVCGCSSLTVASIQVFLEARHTMSEEGRPETLTLNFGGTGVTEESLDDLGEIDPGITVWLMNLSAPPGQHYPAMLPLDYWEEGEDSIGDDDDDDGGATEGDEGIEPLAAHHQQQVFAVHRRPQRHVEYLQAPADSDEPWDGVANQEPSPHSPVVSSREAPSCIGADDRDCAVENWDEALNVGPDGGQSSGPVAAGPGHFAVANPQLAQFVDVEEDLMDVAYSDGLEWGMMEEDADDFLDAEDPAFMNDLIQS